MNKIIFALCLSCLIYSCSEKQKSGLSAYPVNYDGLMDTIIPYFAALHDSIPSSQRFLPKNTSYMQVHKKERQYEWMDYAEKNGYSYFMLSRLQPSLKRDKFTAICGRFKRDASGRVDTASYEELFWTWKMKKDSLTVKADKLFDIAVNGGDLQPYTPEKSEAYWIEFPSATVTYNQVAKTWVTKP
jgi:hypothetical protein